MPLFDQIMNAILGLIAVVVVVAVVYLVFSSHRTEEILADCQAVKGLYVADGGSFRPVYACDHTHLLPEAP